MCNVRNSDSLLWCMRMFLNCRLNQGHIATRRGDASRMRRRVVCVCVTEQLTPIQHHHRRRRWRRRHWWKGCRRCIATITVGCYYIHVPWTVFVFHSIWNGRNWLCHLSNIAMMWRCGIDDCVGVVSVLLTHRCDRLRLTSVCASTHHRIGHDVCAFVHWPNTHGWSGCNANVE